MEDYKKYKWFYTSNKILVVGGKNAENNDDLIRSLKNSGKNYWIMHTSHPGSPFSAVISDKPSKEDIEEAAIFTGCFSKAWKLGLKDTEIHIFRLGQLKKSEGMKIGTWGVNGIVKKMKVKLKLFLIKQKGVLRAVPKGNGLEVCPGKTDKVKMASKIIKALNEKYDKEEVVAALPAGGVKI